MARHRTDNVFANVTPDDIRRILRGWPRPDWMPRDREHVFPGSVVEAEKDSSLYRELGVRRTATDDRIKQAYRELVFKWHPDRNQGSQEADAKFKKITHAYSILSDPQKRKMYDTTGVIPSG